MEDEIIEVYGPEIGVHGIAVYAALAKYANKAEQSYPSLRTLCETLKIGRKTLLNTLRALESADLISIEPGGRTTVSVYTLLDVPQKGGSNENHVVPDKTTGGSNENQGWFQREPEGGSDQNQNQTHREPYPENQTEEPAREESPPDDVTSACLLLLRRVKGLKKDYGELAVLLSELREEFPGVDAVATCKEYELYHRNPPKPTKNHALKLRRFFITAANSSSGGRKQAQASQQNSDGEQKPVSKPRVVTDEEMGYEPTPESERMSDEEYERKMAELGL